MQQDPPAGREHGAVLPWASQAGLWEVWGAEVIWIDLPYPPSTNNLYFTAGNGKRVPTKECKEFKEIAKWQAVRQKAPWIMGHVVLDVILHPKAKKDGTASAVRIDLSNCLKAAEDALQGVCYENDRQVIGVHLRLSEEAVPSGAMRVMVRPA